MHSVERIVRYIEEAEAAGTEVLLDGRSWNISSQPGHYVGPTILLHSSADDPAMQDEIFGAVLSKQAARPNELLMVYAVVD